MAGYALYGRAGWTLGTISPSSYDDGFAGPFQNVMPTGTVWYMGGTAYNTYYVSSNGYLTFGGGSGAIISGVGNILGFYLCPSDNYWGTNGTNTTFGNTPSGFAYRYGVTSQGYNFFSANMMAYTYGQVGNAPAPGGDKGWEVNCFWNYDNSIQMVEFVYSPAFGYITGSIGIKGTYATAVDRATFQPSPNTSIMFSSTDRGVTWNYQGRGSFTVGSF